MTYLKKSFTLFVWALLIQSYNVCAAKPQIGDYGIVSLAYHRFGEDKYPSTNVSVGMFKQHLRVIAEEGMSFINVSQFSDMFKKENDRRVVFLTIDHGYASFYKNAWPILKRKKIPFVIFVSTEEIGALGYMTWAQIAEIASYPFVCIGNHTHTHQTLVGQSKGTVQHEIDTASKLFEENIKYEPKLFAYPFGEYGLASKKAVAKRFDFAFGQQSGPIDATKDRHALPRYAINEKYGERERFKKVLSTLPLKYTSIEPQERYFRKAKAPEVIRIEFPSRAIGSNSQLSCYSDWQNKWKPLTVTDAEKNTVNIELGGKFSNVSGRGRVNCSLRENNGLYRWLGLVFVIEE